jgi:hypothetical protein
MGVGRGRGELSLLSSHLGSRPRRRAFAVLALATLGLHVALLADLRWTWPSPVEPPIALRVRLVGSGSMLAGSADATSTRLETRPSAAAETAPESVKVVAQPFIAHSVRKSQREATADPMPRAEALVSVAPSLAPSPSPAPSLSPSPSPSPASSKSFEPTASTATPVASVPIYRTLIPPSTTLRFALRRGTQEGLADLRWEAGEEGYRLEFEARIGELTLFRQQSQGAFDAAGLAPLRYTDRRARRALATNFQREAGRVSFSAASGSHALQDGSQDRLSWILQLVAVLTAEPQRLAPGQVVTLVVAGVRGAPVAWSFVSAGLDLDAGVPASPSTVRLVREGEGPYDARVEVWIDPERGHLPVRVRFGAATEAQTMDLRLLAAEP